MHCKFIQFIIISCVLFVSCISNSPTNSAIVTSKTAAVFGGSDQEEGRIMSSKTEVSVAAVSFLSRSGSWFLPANLPLLPHMLELHNDIHYYL
jgi:hypothetical protein